MQQKQRSYQYIPSPQRSFRSIGSQQSIDRKLHKQKLQYRDLKPHSDGKDSPKNLPEKLNVNVFKDYNTMILHMLYVCSLTLMVIFVGCFTYYRNSIDLHPHYTSDYSLAFAIFYITANSLVIFRLLGVMFLTQVAHALMHAIVIGLMLLRFFDDHNVSEDTDFALEFYFSQYIVIAIYSLQFIFSFPLVAFMPTTVKYYNPTSIWLHVHTGVLTFFVVSWNFMLQISMLCVRLNHEISSLEHTNIPSIMMVASTLYVLCIMFILLMPTFNFTVRNALDDSADINRKSILDSRHRFTP